MKISKKIFIDLFHCICFFFKSSSRNDFGHPEVARGIDLKILRNPSSRRFRTIDEMIGKITLKVNIFH